MISHILFFMQLYLIYGFRRRWRCLRRYVGAMPLELCDAWDSIPARRNISDAGDRILARHSCSECEAGDSTLASLRRRAGCAFAVRPILPLGASSVTHRRLSGAVHLTHRYVCDNDTSTVVNHHSNA